METRLVQLRTHQKNMSRYENMLKTELTDLERKFVQKRLSEERFTIALLQCMSPSAPSREYDRPRER
jgi:5-bromo-4-chloroindolyl phosphate hydrolysis protein